jgi:hypothetical protein
MRIRICFKYDPVVEVSKFRGDSKFSTDLGVSVALNTAITLYHKSATEQ